MSLNDTSVHPTGALGVEYAGTMNPTPAAIVTPEAAYATSGDMSGHVEGGSTNDDGNAPAGILTGHVPPAGDAGARRDVVEGAPGVIESSELAPLGEDKVAADPSLVSRATGMAKETLRSAGVDV